MNNYECSKCGKVYKSKSGLNKHFKKCDVQIETEEVDKPTETVNNQITQEIKRRIEKLEHTISRCYDAETKHRLEEELKDLKGRVV